MKGSFTNFSTEGVIQASLHKRLNKTPARKWSKPYYQTIEWVRAKSQLFVIKPVAFFLRHKTSLKGTREKIRSLTFEVGEAASYY